MESIQNNFESLEKFDSVAKYVDKISYEDLENGDIILIDFEDSRNNGMTVYTFFVCNKNSKTKTLKCLGTYNKQWLFNDGECHVGSTQDSIGSNRDLDQPVSTNIVKKIRIISQTNIEESQKINNLSMIEMLNNLPVGTVLTSFTGAILKIVEVEKIEISSIYKFKSASGYGDLVQNTKDYKLNEEKNSAFCFQSQDIDLFYQNVAQITSPSGNCYYYNGVPIILLEAMGKISAQEWLDLYYPDFSRKNEVGKLIESMLFEVLDGTEHSEEEKILKLKRLLNHNQINSL